MNSIRKCLLIDDDPGDQEIFLMCIKKINQQVECLTMNTGVEALEMLTSNTNYIPDFIFLNVNIPKMNGIECLKLLKKIDRLKSTKIFLYSTSTTNVNVFYSESIQFGASDFIFKPARSSELKEKLASIFQIVSKIKM